MGLWGSQVQILSFRLSLDGTSNYSTAWITSILLAKKVAKNIQSDVDKNTRATINNLIMGFNEHIDSFKFNEKNISDEQVHIENPGLLEEKLTKR